MVFVTIGQAFLCFKTTRFVGIFIHVLEATVFASRLFRSVSFSDFDLPVKVDLRIYALLCALCVGCIHSELL